MLKFNFLYLCRLFNFFFFFNDTATTEIYTLSLHDALPISLVIAVQVIARAGIEPVSPAQDREVVMTNGHFVPLWVKGQPLASPYLGVFMWSLVGAVASRQWTRIDRRMKEPIAVLFAVVLASFAAWFVAYWLEWLFPLRTSVFRGSLLLTLVWLPFVIAYLVGRLRQGERSSAIV